MDNRYRDMLDMGENIVKSVADAINNNDYSKLNESIRSQMNAFTQQQNSAANPFQQYRVNPTSPGNAGQGSQGAYNAKPNPANGKTQGSGTGIGNGQSNYTNYQAGTKPNFQNSNYQTGGRATGYEKMAKPNPPRPSQVGVRSGTAKNQVTKPETPFLTVRPSYVGSALKRGFGAVGTIGLGALAVMAVLGGALIGFSADLLVGVGFLAAGAGGFGFLTANGAKSKKLIDRFFQYGKVIGNAEYIPVKVLSERAGETTDTTLSNLDKMIKNRYLPTAKFDKDKKNLILTDHAYGQYLEAERSHNAALEAKRRENEEIESLNIPESAKRVLREGKEYIKLVRECNVLIPGEEMTGKLDQLETTVYRIFEQVKIHPDQADNLRRFLNYYLPTTEKLLRAYIDLEKKPEVENVTNAKREIENVIDTINDAFEKLFNDLFEDMAWDISSDISVMRTMMAQDGLTDDDIMTGAKTSFQEMAQDDAARWAPEEVAEQSASAEEHVQAVSAEEEAWTPNLTWDNQSDNNNQ